MKPEQELVQSIQDFHTSMDTFVSWLPEVATVVLFVIMAIAAVRLWLGRR